MNAIEVHEVYKHYPGTEALKGISFQVTKGSVHGFLGPNGAGKSTTLKIITGLSYASKGSVLINGHVERGQQIGFLPEFPPLYPNMRVHDYLDFVLSSKDPSLKRPKRKELADSALERCGLMQVRERAIGNLSKGYQQRVGLAQALSTNPPILILDEPTVGLDPMAIQEIRDLIRSLRGQHTILFSSHMLHEVELLCDEITIINQGKVLQSGPLHKIQQSLDPKQVIKVLCRQKNLGSLEHKLREAFPLESYKQDQRGDLTELKLVFNQRKSYQGKLHDDAELCPRVCSHLVQLGVEIVEFQTPRPDLESVFHQVTEGGMQ